MMAGWTLKHGAKSVFQSSGPQPLLAGDQFFPRNGAGGQGGGWGQEAELRQGFPSQPVPNRALTGTGPQPGRWGPQF